MSDAVNGRTHQYHAEATILSGFLTLPLAQEVRSQARVSLPEKGGYVSQHVDKYRLEGVLSYSAAYTQVAGNRDTKPGHGWTTLATSVIEGFNLLEIVTADRIVGQVITEHPIEGYVPSINFLGTRFENLRIAGHPVSLDMNHNIFGGKPSSDASYVDDPGVHDRAANQYKNVLRHDDLPADLRERYVKLSSTHKGADTVHCSLVNQMAGSFPGRSYGHVITIPEFGKISLCKLSVTSEDLIPGTRTPRKTTVSLTMIDFELGCFGSGGFSGGRLVTNGQSNP